ncbi:MAG: quinoprotein relay system zinc metallohydrolase 1 [Halarcobacter sp.]
MRLLISLLICFIPLLSKEFNYKLKPIKLSNNSYYFYGKEEYFSNKNGGNISNTAFIETDKSVILIDTGSSFNYGKQLKKAIAKVTNKPIKYVINTHHHPDHFLGNNAFKDSTIFATQFTADEIETNGNLYIENLVNLVGSAMTDTSVKKVDKILNKKVMDFDGYKLHFIYLSGHTEDDLVIYDENTKILYASDLVFNHRALATPHANLDKWIESLNKLKNIDFKLCFPGHGLVFENKKAIEENIKYLKTIRKNINYGLKNGLDVFEVLDLKVPKDIRGFSIFEQEYERSIINLYNKKENIVNKKLY